MPSSTSKPVVNVNRLLASLPRSEYLRVVSDCEPVELALAAVLGAPGESVSHVLFPVESFISLIAPINGHAGLEVGLIGNEGMFGISVLLGVDASPLHAIVQGAGPALRMETGRFRRELDGNPALHGILLRYIHVMLGQLAQNAACTHFHRVDVRLARWLLMTADRAHGNAFHLTHEFLAFMLGVRRAGVTKAAFSLQARKLISYHRGDITILDRVGLEAVSCGCYAADKTMYARTMG
jgi:CRP-like cAMP-binding protein